MEWLRVKDAPYQPDPMEIVRVWTAGEQGGKERSTYADYLHSLMQWQSQLETVRPYLNDEGGALLEELEYLLELSRLVGNATELRDLVCWDSSTVHRNSEAVSRIRYRLDCLADGEGGERNG